MSVTKVIDLGGNKTVVDQNNFHVRRVAEYYGNSADTKPTNAKNADRFIEMDTVKLYLFDEDSGNWYPV